MKKSFSEKAVQLCLIASMLICGLQCAFGQNVDPEFGTPIVVSDWAAFDRQEIQIVSPEKSAYPWKSQLKKSILPGSLALLSGAAGGLHEGLQFRRTEFFRAFPKANRDYWDTNISSEVQPHFMGAARDGYHDAQYFHTGLLFASGASAGIIVAVPLIRKEKRPWWHVCVDIGIQGGASLAGYILGSRLVYDVILHR